MLRDLLHYLNLFSFMSLFIFMQCSFGVFPRTDEIQKTMRLPLVISVTPGDSGAATPLDLKIGQLMTCKVCKSYLTCHCKLNSDNWECSICSNINTISDKHAADVQSKCDSFEVLVQRSEELGPIFVLYVSLEYSESQFVTVKQQFESVLDCMPEGAKCLIFVGSNQCEIEVLVPPRQAPSNPDLNLSTPFSSVFEVDSDIGNTAAIARFASFQSIIGLDLASFFFDSTTFDTAKRAMSQIHVAKNTDGIVKSLRLVGTLANAFGNVPFRFISMLDVISGDPHFFEMMRQATVRVDFLVMQYNSFASSMSKSVPGTIQLVDANHAIEQIRTIMGNNTKYQLFARCRARRASVEWKPRLKPYSESRQQNIFCPICVTDYQAFAIDVNILPNQDEFVFQVTTKFTDVTGPYTNTKLRVFSKLVKTSPNLRDVLASMNPDVVMWYWSEKLMIAERQNAISGLFRAVATIITQCEHVPPTFIHAVLTAPDWDITSDSKHESSLASDLICFSNPSRIHFIPHLNKSQTVCQSPNGVAFTNEEGREEANTLAQSLPVFKGPSTPIPSSFIEDDPARKKKLFDLVAARL